MKTMDINSTTICSQQHALNVADKRFEKTVVEWSMNFLLHSEIEDETKSDCKHKRVKPGRASACNIDQPMKCLLKFGMKQLTSSR